MTAAGPRHAAPEVDIAHPSVGTLVKEASGHFSTLLRSEIELAKSEVKGEVKKAVTGSGFLAAAGVIVALSFPFFFVFVAELLVDPIGLPRWSAYLIVFAFFIVVAALLALLGIKKVKKVRAPERTISSVKKNAELIEAIKGDHEAPPTTPTPLQARVAARR